MNSVALKSVMYVKGIVMVKNNKPIEHTESIIVSEYKLFFFLCFTDPVHEI
jgi:hypothetical protein